MELVKKFQGAVFLLKIYKRKKEKRAENQGKKNKSLVKMHIVKRFRNNIHCIKDEKQRKNKYNREKKRYYHY